MREEGKFHAPFDFYTTQSFSFVSFNYNRDVVFSDVRWAMEETMLFKNVSVPIYGNNVV